jgi:hypothetical protein
MTSRDIGSASLADARYQLGAERRTLASSEALGFVPTSLFAVRHGFARPEPHPTGPVRPRSQTVSSQPSAISIGAIRGLSTAAKVNAAGLVLTAAGMLVQIAAGSTLYPSVTGPIVLIVSAIFVAFGPGRWTPWVGLVIPLVLGLGAIVAAVMTGDFVDQLTDVGRPGLVVGSLLHVIGLIAAIAGGVVMVLGRRGSPTGER